MEYTPEAIEALTVNEVEIMKKIAAELEIRMSQVSAVISLVVTRLLVLAILPKHQKVLSL